MDRQAVLAAFDEQVRRNPAPRPGGRVERDAGIVRVIDPGGWSGVVWSDLDAGSADRAIDRQLARFAGLAGWEWKHYGYDRPVDLPRRLAAAGLVPGPPEALLVAELPGLDPRPTEALPVAELPVLAPRPTEALPVAELPGLAPRPTEALPVAELREPAATEPTNAVDPPNGRTRVPAGPTPTGAKPAGMLGGEPSVPPDVRLVPVTDSVGVGLLVRVHREAFGRVHPALGAALLARLADEPGSVAAVVALAGDRPVCAGRVEFHRGTEFASLWGGGTVPDWRGRGLFRALVAYRAALAAARGFRYLQVDALPASEPILARLGFARLTTTTPYTLPDPA